MSESMAGALAAVQLDAMTFHSRLVRQGGALERPASTRASLESARRASAKVYLQF